MVLVYLLSSDADWEQGLGQLVTCSLMPHQEVTEPLFLDEGWPTELAAGAAGGGAEEGA